MAPQWSEAEFSRLLEPNDAPLQRSFLVITLDGMVAGFAVYTQLQSVFPPEVELESLAVAVAYRRRGLAGALLRAVTAAVTALGAEYLVLEVRASNAAALALYRAVGFQGTGIRRAYYTAPAEDAVLMQLVFRNHGFGASNDLLA
jgi:ribosomal-protein-alanine N-acetyltransferase